ncbi:MAG: nucleotidyltransferase family protein [Nitrospira sp.]|nr:nucleotidyltransferase family protein [Nitrospira sp.]
MLTLPAIHPFLTDLLTEHVRVTQHPAALSDQIWHRIIEDALAQRVAPLLYQWVNLPGHQSFIPSTVRNRLKRELMQHSAWNLLLTTELRAILVACDQQGIPCIPLRGPVLAERLYGDRSIRQMDDLDLLIHRKDLQAVKGIFERFGYQQHEQRAGFHEDFSYSLEFVHPTHGFLVEPHWTLAYPPHLELEPMRPVWMRCQRRRWLDLDIHCLSVEDLILHLCLHLQHKGRQAPLLWFYELDTVTRRHGTDLDWNVFIEQVRLMQQSPAIAEVLTLLSNTFHSPLPDSVITRLTDPPGKSSSSGVLMIEKEILVQSLPDSGEEFAMLASLHDFKNKLRYTLSLVFPSPQYMTRRYGTSTPVKLAGWYLARFCRIGVEGFRFALTWIMSVRRTRHN